MKLYQIVFRDSEPASAWAETIRMGLSPASISYFQCSGISVLVVEAFGIG